MSMYVYITYSIQWSSYYVSVYIYINYSIQWSSYYVYLYIYIYVLHCYIKRSYVLFICSVAFKWAQRLASNLYPLVVSL
jgi:hypothetical protein